MSRKRKAVPKLTAEESKAINSESDNVTVHCDAKDNTKKNIANICHKNCHGANNWKAFKESLPNLKEAGTKKPQNKRSDREILNRTNTTTVGTSGNENDQNSTAGKSLPSNTQTNSNLQTKLPKNRPKEANNPPVKKHCQNEDLRITKHIAIDCEMVGVEIGVDKNMLARISMVNSFGKCIYDKFVKPTEPVLDYRTHVSGVRPEDLENAEDFKIVQKEVSDILKGKILIGHDLKHDLRVLFLSHPRPAIRDTSKFKKFRESKRTPSLKKLAIKYLGVSIQEGEHSSVQDALAAMQLYRMFKKEWETSLRARPSCLKSKVKENKKPNPKVTVDT